MDRKVKVLITQEVELEKTLIELQKIKEKFNQNAICDNMILEIHCKGPKQISIKTMRIAFNDKTKLISSAQRFKRSDCTEEFLNLLLKYDDLHNILKALYVPFNEYYSFIGFQNYDSENKLITFIEYDGTVDINSAIAGNYVREGYSSKTKSMQNFIGL